MFGLNFNFKRLIGKTKERSQMLFIVTSDGRGVERETPVLTGCAVDDELCAGYLLDGPNQYQNEMTKDWTQIVDEKCTVPYCSIAPERIKLLIDDKKDDSGKTKMTSLIQGIYNDSCVNGLSTIDRQTKEEQQRSKLTFLFGLAVIICILMIARGVFF